MVQAALAKGTGVVLIYSGIPTLERAHDIRRGVFRCSNHRGLTGDAGPSNRLVTDPDEMGVRKNRDGTYSLHYRVWDKRSGKKRLLAKYGPDRSKWPYDPRRKATAAEREAMANRDETGRIVRH